jgi:hypothetical protein
VASRFQRRIDPKRLARQTRDRFIDVWRNGRAAELRKCAGPNALSDRRCESAQFDLPLLWLGARTEQIRHRKDKSRFRGRTQSAIGRRSQIREDSVNSVAAA